MTCKPCLGHSSEGHLADVGNKTLEGTLRDMSKVILMPVTESLSAKKRHSDGWST